MPEIVISNDKDALNLRGGNLKAFKSRDSYVVLVGGAGTGKSLLNSELILTPDGYKNISDIKTGDIVYSVNGNETVVTGVYPQGQLDIYEVVFSDNTKLICSNDHLWNVQPKTYKKTTEQNLPLDDFITLPLSKIRKSLYKNYRIPLVKPIQFNSKSLEIHPYLMGVLLGDGLLGPNIRILSPDEELLENVKKLIPYSLELRYKKNRQNYIVRKEQCGENIVTRELKKLNLYGKRNINKFIPKDYLFNSIENRIELLKGLMDANGHIDAKGNIEYRTVSETLKNDIVFLIQSLGGTAKVTERIIRYTYKETKISGKKSYIIRIKIPKDIIPFSISRKIERLNLNKPEPKRVITKVNYIGKDECTCIAVEDESHLYVANNFIVTHNTFALCWKMHFYCILYPGVRVLLTRKSLRSLRDSAVRTYQEVLRQSAYDRVVRTLGETRPTNFIYPHSERVENGVKYSGKSEIILAPLDTKGKALGSEYDMVYVNQPDTEGCTLEEFKLIRSRARLQNAPYRQLICDPNPSYDKHWLLANSKSELNPNGDWEIITSIHKDNPALYDPESESWTDLGLEQMKELENLPGHLRESLFLGKWFSVAGMAFAEYWKPHKHILYLESEEAQSLGVSVDNGDGTFQNIIPQDWDHYLAIDWGFNDPYVCLLIARHPTKDLFIVHRHIYITKKDITEVADLTVSMTAGYNIKAIVADRGRAETTIMENALGKSINGAIKNNTSNMDSMNVCISELNADRWKFVELQTSLYNIPDPELKKKNKPMGYDEIPNLKLDDKTGKIADNQADHFYDAWKYFCRYWVDSNKTKKTSRFLWI